MSRSKDYLFDGTESPEVTQMVEDASIVVHLGVKMYCSACGTSVTHYERKDAHEWRYCYCVHMYEKDRGCHNLLWKERLRPAPNRD